MQVTFYKTKLSGQNRCYDKVAYDNYLASCTKEVVNIAADIIPSTTFYVPPHIRDGFVVTGAIQWQKYNYITYTYAGMKYGSFIVSIQPLASNSTVAIAHSTDNWYYLLQNFTDNDGNPEFGLHGQVSRAHVNDFEAFTKGSLSYRRPTMKNTFLSPESSCSSNGVSIEYYDLNPKDATTLTYNAHYIYCLINNPNQTGFSYGEGGSGGKYENNAHQFFQTSIGRKQRSINMLMCGALSDDGIICWAVFDGTYTGAIADEWKTYLINLQSEAITKIVVSDIPPNKYCSLQRDSNGIAYIRYNIPTDSSGAKVDGIGLGHTTDLQGLPTNFSIINTFTESTLHFYLQPSITATDLILYDGSTDVMAYMYNTYDSYKKYGLAKLHSPAYNSLYYCDKIIDYSKANINDIPTSIPELECEIGMDYSTNFYYSTITNLETIDKESAYATINCYNAFDPVVRKSYFDKYDLTTATANATTKKINLGFGLFNSAVGALSSGANILSSKNKIGAIADMATSTSNLVNDISTIGYKYKSINAEKDKAVGQINNGNISSDTAVGYYAFAGKQDIFTAYLRFLNDDGYEQLAAMLHRYGYNTPLQVDDIYKNHKRQYFNYIECSSCEIDGVPLDIAEDISSMFESGVHLWNGTVGEWEVPNWQVDIYEWIKGGKT